jgi:beta-mannosidase
MRKTHGLILLSVLWGAAFALAGGQTGSAPSPRLQGVVLNQGWQFRQTKPNQKLEENWLSAHVPGDLHLDLLANKAIPDPFYRDNEQKLQWIENVGWEYRLDFDVSAATVAHANVDLVFEGIDGPATVFLNGVQILQATNAFRVWRIPVKAHMHAGKNHLWVHFDSPIYAADQLARKDPWMGKSGTEGKTLLRKPAYEYGWDWGPRFVTSGLWKPVRIEVWNQARIEDFAVHESDVSRDVAHVDAEVEVIAAKTAQARVALSCEELGAAAQSRSVLLHAGSNKISFPVEVRKPRLWFPAGYGEQPLYHFKATVVSGAESPTASRAVGLRSVVLRRDLDKWGRSFELVVNGIPIFAKGADVIPFDSFASRVTEADYRRILTSARNANMNMIRHWGGGYYESDAFYSICDELGLMVWQDFQFGNDWQPGNYSFKQNIEAEADEQVTRLRNHPSIVLWSGNNETELAFGWGRRNLLPNDVRMQMWQDYLTEFSGILNRVVARLAPETPYWPSSPSADYEPQTPTFHSGDDHIWDVWHGRVPFSSYETHHARFVSEFGFQSFPEMATVESFTTPQDRANIFTPVMQAHQKNNEGNSIIHDYMLRDYGEPKDFASFLYASQVLQAEGIKIGAEYFRRSRPETMGSIFWQLNDCWPVASWSSIDYTGRWKALQYYAKRFYAPVLASPHIENGAVRVYIVNDTPDKLVGATTLRVRMMDMSGRILLDDRKPVKVDPLSSRVYTEWPLKRITDSGVTDTSRVFVLAELTSGNTTLSRNILYLAPTKGIHLLPVKLKVDAFSQTPWEKDHRAWSPTQREFVSARNLYKVRVYSPVLARDVALSFGTLDVDLSDNYFDVLPGETFEVYVWSNASLEQIKAQMKTVTLTDAFQNTAATVSAGR